MTPQQNIHNSTKKNTKQIIKTSIKKSRLFNRLSAGRFICILHVFFIVSVHANEDNTPKKVATQISKPDIKKKTKTTLIKMIKSRDSRPFAKRMAALKKGQRAVVRLTQFGDSHSAAEFFTGELRKRLQNKYGSAGIGWIPPTKIRGHRHDLVTYTDSQLMLSDSRLEARSDFPMGGFVATAEHADAQQSLLLDDATSADYVADWRVTIKAKNPFGNMAALSLIATDNSESFFEADPSPNWHVRHFDMAFPTLFISHTKGTEIGGIWLEKSDAKGFIVETIAQNGAQNTIWNRWNSETFARDLAISRPDIVTLAYGTNEAFNSTLTAEDFRRDFRERMRWLKNTLPDAKIIIIGAPESYHLSRDDKEMRFEQLSTCHRPHLLDEVQRAQADIARQENVLFWDWQKTMGGRCQVSTFIENGLMQNDGVHFTRQGYVLSASRFYDFLQTIL